MNDIISFMLPISVERAKRLVEKSRNSVFDPISGPLTAGEKGLINNIAVALLSGTEGKYLSVHGAEKWAIGRYAHHLAQLPDELRYSLQLDVASRPERFGLILEQFIEYLLVESDEYPAPITSLVQPSPPRLEQQRADDVAKATVRLFQTAHRHLWLEPIEPKGIE